MLVNDPDNPGSFIWKSKLIFQCSIADIHGDLYSPTTGLGNDVIYKDSIHLVSDTMFWGLLPPELRVMSNHYKTVCCCKIFQGFNYLQSALNSFRVHFLAVMVKELQRMPDKTARQRNDQSIALAKKTMYKQQEFNGEEALHPRGRDACTAMQCLTVGEFSDTGITNLQCASGNCNNCGTLNSPTIEGETDKVIR